MDARPLTRHAPLALVLAFAAAACAGDPSDEASADDAVTSGGDRGGFEPVADWTGTLVLPAVGERADGAVRFVVRQAPDASLVGRAMWLSLADTRERRDVTRDVAFSAAARESMAKGNVHPDRLDGRRAVSPLESLAAAHPKDDVRVALAGARREGDTLVIDREPVVIDGDWMALVTFERSVEGPAGSYAARHFDRRTRGFDGARRVMVLDAPALPVGGNGEVRAPADGIERSSLNREGFYVYGDFDKDVFHVRAVEPRHLRKLPTTKVRRGAREAAAFATREVWNEQRKGQASSTLLVPDGVPAGADAPAEWAAANLVEGTELLVLHLFGGIGPAESRLPTGHFSFGIARVARDRLSGELGLTTEYRQVYAHNPNGVISGTQSWHSYEGSFARGWMFSRPVVDTMLFAPMLTRTYDLGGVRFRPLDGLVRELEAMTARYRIGNGTGASIVTPASSCVQDSSQALFFALMKLEEDVFARSEVVAHLASRPDDADSRDLVSLRALAATVSQYLSPLGVARADWRRNASNLAAVSACPGSAPGQVFCALASYNTIFPRTANDLFVRSLLEAGAGGVVLSTAQIGGDMPGITPLAPRSPLGP